MVNDDSLYAKEECYLVMTLHPHYHKVSFMAMSGFYCGNADIEVGSIFVDTNLWNF